ncbi:MAG: GGDEF domain-containing protein [Bacilli bacterium]|jgi:diguanylate cyclase (GGDEF)-like protein|nr:GGDEF domain-containing protein [Bacilli bacterium]
MDKLQAWLSIDIISALLLCYIVFASLYYNRNEKAHSRTFRFGAYMTLGMIICDSVTAWTYTSPAMIVICQILSYMYYVLTIMMAISWLVYSYYQVFEHIEKKTARWLNGAVITGLIDFVLVNVSLVNGMYWSYNAKGEYVRGDLFYIHVILIALIVIEMELMTILYRKKMNRRYALSLMLFPVVPMFGLIAQYFLILPYGFVGIALGMLEVITNIQGRSLDYDYLTGAYNRRKLDFVLEQKVSSAANGKTFSALLIDLDNFKLINDTCGHLVGDQALIDAVRIMQKCLKNKDLVARYGGDEFCIVSEIDNEKALTKLILDIKQEVDNYNKAAERPFKLGFSIGQAIYNPSEKKDFRDFEKLIDERMYIEKERAHQGR